MTAIDKLNALREEIEELESDIKTKEGKLKSLQDQCKLALDVAAEFEEQKALLELEIEELKAGKDEDRKSESADFRELICVPLESGNPGDEPQVLKYAERRKLDLSVLSEPEADQEALQKTG